MPYKALCDLTTVYLSDLSRCHFYLAHYTTVTLDILFLENTRFIPDLGLLSLPFPLPGRLFPFHGSVSVSKVLWEHSHACSFTTDYGCFVLQ